MRIEIREMADADLESVAWARAEGWRQVYRGAVPQEVLEGMRPEAFVPGPDAGRPGAPHGRVHLVADAGAQGVIGWAHFGAYRPDDSLDPGPGGPRTAPPDGELYALHVREAFRGRGLGRALLSASVRALAGSGHRRLRLWVPRANAAARRFCVRAGLRPDGAEREAELGGVRIGELRYTRALDPAGRLE